MIYVSTSRLFDNRTFAIFRNAEFGFFGFRVNTLNTTPFFCGFPSSAVLTVLSLFAVRGFLII